MTSLFSQHDVPKVPRLSCRQSGWRSRILVASFTGSQIVNLPSPTVSQNSRGNPLVILGSLVVFAVAAYTLAQYVIQGDIPGLAYVALLCVGGAFVVAMLNNWRRGVYFFFTWLVFEDFARKFLGNNMAIYFAKDFLLAVVYISFFIAYRRKTVKTIRPPFAFVPLLCFVWFGILQVFNPASTALVYGILGVKLFYLYIPLFFVGYALLDSELELRRFFKVNAFLILIITSIGITQSIVGPSFLNPSRPAEEIRELSQLYRTSPITGLVSYRAPSVFVSTGRYTNFLLIAWCLTLAFTAILVVAISGRPQLGLHHDCSHLRSYSVVRLSRSFFVDRRRRDWNCFLLHLGCAVA